jgi:hypothetical protein
MSAWIFAVCAFGCSVYDESVLTGARRNPAAATVATSPRASEAAAAGSASEAAPAPAADGGSPGCAAGASEDYCGVLPALPDPALLDGQLECGLRLAPMATVGWNGPAELPDKRPSYAAAWRHDGIYFYVEVRGAEPIVPHPAEQPIFCGDAVELYVDADAHNDDAGTYDPAGTMQFVIAAPGGEGSAIETAKFTQGVPHGAWISKAVRTTRLADGYSIEAFISAADIDLWEWTPSMRVGFSVVVDISGPGGSGAAGCSNRAGQFFVRAGEPLGPCRGEPWCDAGAFCRAALMPP